MGQTKRLLTDDVENDWYIMDTKGNLVAEVDTPILYLKFIQNGVFAFINKNGEGGLMNMYGDILVKGERYSFADFAFAYDEKTYAVEINNCLEIYDIVKKSLG